MIKAKFPVYALRGHESIENKGVYVLVHTHYATYILDIPELEGDFISRRLKMLCMDLPYKVYPLKEKFNTLGQMSNSKRRYFIDLDGKLWNYKPNKYYRVCYTKVLHADVTWNGKYMLVTKLPVKFVTQEVANYVGYIQVGAGYYLYDFSQEVKPTTRKKI